MTNFERFDDLPICEKTKRAIKDMGLDYMTDIQKKAIPPLLNLQHLVGTAKTGEGKTLCFLIPAIELLYKVCFKHRNGTGAIIISPTRELATQTFTVLKQLMKYHSQSCGLIIGGQPRKKQVEDLSKGINILVVTPGRLLDHLQNTPEFNHRCAGYIVIDEADHLLDIGFGATIQQVFNLLQTQFRLNVLFTASLTERTKNFIASTFKVELQYVGEKEMATVINLKQSYVLINSEHKLFALFKFLEEHHEQTKAIVFFNSRATVEYCHRLFNVHQIPNLYLHAQLDQKHRLRTFRQFSKMKTGYLLCSDVAARGLDIPSIDWVIQFDVPFNYRTYLHRVGRTARGINNVGKSLIFLRPEELEFKSYIRQDGSRLYRYVNSLNGYDEFHSMIETTLSCNSYLLELARDAFRSTLNAYNSCTLSDVCNINNLDQKKLATSFGLRHIPPIQPEEPKKRKRIAAQSNREFKKQK